MPTSAHCFVTGGTGFLGRFVIADLLRRGATVHALVRPQSFARLRAIGADLGAGEDRLIPVPGDISRDGLTVDPFDAPIDHLIHLAAIYDMTADDETNETMNVGGTRIAVELADALRVGCFHQVSSVAAAGE